MGNCAILSNIRQWNFPRLRVFQMACSKEWSHWDLRDLNLNCRWISSFIKCFVKAWDGTCPSKRLWICSDSKTDLNLGSTNQTNQTTSKNYYILTPACADDPVWAYFSTGWHNYQLDWVFSVRCKLWNIDWFTIQAANFQLRDLHVQQLDARWPTRKLLQNKSTSHTSWFYKFFTS